VAYVLLAEPGDIRLEKVKSTLVNLLGSCQIVLGYLLLWIPDEPEYGLVA
jgi:hypothetical protein